MTERRELTLSFRHSRGARVGSEFGLAYEDEIVVEKGRGFERSFSNRLWTCLGFQLTKPALFSTMMNPPLQVAAAWPSAGRRAPHASCRLRSTTLTSTS